MKSVEEVRDYYLTESGISEAIATHFMVSFMFICIIACSM